MRQPRPARSQTKTSPTASPRMNPSFRASDARPTRKPAPRTEPVLPFEPADRQPDRRGDERLEDREVLGLGHEHRAGRGDRGEDAGADADDLEGAGVAGDEPGQRRGDRADQDGRDGRGEGRRAEERDERRLDERGQRQPVGIARDRQDRVGRDPVADLGEDPDEIEVQPVTRREVPRDVDVVGRNRGTPGRGRGSPIRSGRRAQADTEGSGSARPVQRSTAPPGLRPVRIGHSGGAFGSLSRVAARLGWPGDQRHPARPPARSRGLVGDAPDPPRPPVRDARRDRPRDRDGRPPPDDGPARGRPRLLRRRRPAERRPAALRPAGGHRRRGLLPLPAAARDPLPAARPPAVRARGRDLDDPDRADVRGDPRPARSPPAADAVRRLRPRPADRLEHRHRPGPGRRHAARSRSATRGRSRSRRTSRSSRSSSPSWWLGRRDWRPLGWLAVWVAGADRRPAGPCARRTPSPTCRSSASTRSAASSRCRPTRSRRCSGRRWSSGSSCSRSGPRHAATAGRWR